MTVHLLDMHVWSHQNLPGHTTYVRGLYPRYIVHAGAAFLRGEDAVFYRFRDHLSQGGEQ